MSNAHLAFADKNGAESLVCKELAMYISKQLDSTKAGKHERLPKHLKPQEYRHFMQRKGVNIYKSKKVLGTLYDHANAITPPELCPRQIYCDPDMILSGAESFKEEATRYKQEYNLKFRELQHFYDVSEAEIVTGNCWSLAKDRKRQWSRGQKIMFAYEKLRTEFRSFFENLGPNYDDISDAEKQTLYEQKASAWYQVTYAGESTISLPEEDMHEKMLSFGWIPLDHLTRIKKQKSSTE